MDQKGIRCKSETISVTVIASRLQDATEGMALGKAQRALSISQETCLFFVFEILTEDKKAHWFAVSIGLTYCLRIGILPVSFLTDRNNRVTVGFYIAVDRTWFVRIAGMERKIEKEDAR